MMPRTSLTTDRGDSLHEHVVNCLELEGRVTGTPETRPTPAGIPITRFMLEHCSQRQEAGQQREVRCKIGVVAAGGQLHSSMPCLKKDDRLRITGFISQAGYRSGDYQLVLHAEQIEYLE